jgi:SAM-dependent methyltransferase
MKNVNEAVVKGFGEEWSRFDQSELSQDELERMFDNYFNIFPWDRLPANSVGFDVGCGSGRWARLVAPRVGRLHLIDPSDALGVARKNLASQTNCEFHRASVAEIPLDNDSCDFGYSIGVLHHVPDTPAGLRACVEKLKLGAPFLLYLYYRFDGRPWWFRSVWKVSDLGRMLISRSPHRFRYLISQAIAAMVYYPLARGAGLLEKMGLNVDGLPLAQYRYNSFYTMRTDALDRFGTQLEQRFTRAEVEKMMLDSGLRDIKFSQNSFWAAVGYRNS